jgi:hypothetical protein
LWLVATWCSSCQAGTQFLAQQGFTSLQAAGVRVEELELYDDLGQSGPSITQFRRQLAGAAGTSADWQWGVASQAMTERYDPKAYLDIYYLLDRNGDVRYVNGSPASTFSTLLTAVEQTVRPTSAVPSATPGLVVGGGPCSSSGGEGRDDLACFRRQCSRPSLGCFLPAEAAFGSAAPSRSRQAGGGLRWRRVLPFLRSRAMGCRYGP